MRLLISLCLALLALPAYAQSANSQRYVVAASLLYENLEYERALDQLKKARGVSGGVDDDVTIALYEGIILSDMGRKDESVAAFREALYLKPEAKLPVKVAPKTQQSFDLTKVAVTRKLEPILAKRRAEAEAAKKAEAEAEKKRADAEAELKRLETERAELARRTAETDAEKRRLAAERAELTRRMAEQQAAADEAKKKADEQARLAALADRPLERTYRVTIEPKPQPAFVPTTTTQPVARPVPVAPFVLGGLAVAAGVTAGIFGWMSSTELTAARAANFQSETAQHLELASRNALIANIGFGAAGVSALAAFISIFVGREAPPPAAPPQESP